MKWAFILLTWVSGAAGQEKPPVLLTDALRQLANVGILSPSYLKLPEGLTYEGLKSDGLWSPWVIADLDRDGRLDVAAAVIQQTEGETLYGVVAIHASAPKKIHWVRKLEKLPIHGVIARKDGLLVPLRCVYCDANAWLNWTGHGYEIETFSIGQRLALAVAFSAPQKIGVFESPSTDSKIVLEIESCTPAKVMGRRGSTPETRWYSVQTISEPVIRGWVKNENTIPLQGFCEK